MSRLSCKGWTLSQLIEEWNYHYEERLGILYGSIEPESWMIRLAEQNAERTIKKILKEQGLLITEKIENP